MKMMMHRLSLLAVAGLTVAAATASAQVRITGLTPGGELVWTNPAVSRGVYSVEAADSPVGAWTVLTNVVDAEWSRTNRLATLLSVTNGQAFYRVGWVRPDVLGVWDFEGLDEAGALVFTGRLCINSMTLASAESPVVYRLGGTYSCRYVGPGISPFGVPYLFGDGYLGGQVALHTASFSVDWPTNCYDCSIGLSGIPGPDALHAGSWYHFTWARPYRGEVRAIRSAVTNGCELNSGTK